MMYLPATLIVFLPGGQFLSTAIAVILPFSIAMEPSKIPSGVTIFPPFNTRSTSFAISFSFLMLLSALPGFVSKRFQAELSGAGKLQPNLKSRFIFRHPGGSRYPSPPPWRWENFLQTGLPHHKPDRLKTFLINRR